MTPRAYYESIKHVLPPYHRGVLEGHLTTQRMAYFYHEAEIDIEDDVVLHHVSVHFVGGGYVYERFSLTSYNTMANYYGMEGNPDAD